MGAVNQTVNPTMRTDLQQARDLARNMTDDSLWRLEYAIDTAVANVISSAGIRNQIETAVQAVIDNFKRNHP
jgi:hypothetical protein